MCSPMQDGVLQALRDKLASCEKTVACILVAAPVATGPHGSPVGILEVFLCARDDVLSSVANINEKCDGVTRLWGHGWLSSMAVNAESRRRGCASALLSEAERVVARWGYSWVALSVDTSNTAACRLYEKFGYEYIQRERPFWVVWKDRSALMAKNVSQL
jgi:ribosomal protein S18 acetylase RimI-like enzyme